MNVLRRAMLPSACASLLMLGLSNPAHAFNIRSFVSANGNDANPCTRALPCRTFQVAHDKTSTGGEVNTLDPAGYGTLVITKSISILNEGGIGIFVISVGGNTVEGNAFNNTFTTTLTKK